MFLGGVDFQRREWERVGCGRLVGRWKEEGTGSWEVDGVKKTKSVFWGCFFLGENGGGGGGRLVGRWKEEGTGSWEVEG